RDSHPATRMVWATLGRAPGRKYGGGGDDQLPARGALGATVRGLVEDGSVEVVRGLPAPRPPRRGCAGGAVGGFQARRVSFAGGRVALADEDVVIEADEIIAATGFRPDLALLGE